jgi:hypothetical protein
MSRNSRFYMSLAAGLVVIVAVVAFVTTGGHLPGMKDSPSAQVSGQTAR